ncbi:OLC1v1003451C1 [Oldenlandia corymbosa var. corymbosa]|uniref:Dirigent protein n=1 Tax=Oldenlandia corymbosa var. corymbosa TaxID=529605 RepID=A0AAV1DA86_OLDCO|nr:OLC1v1003451C1 [Oldenlandia corymbosa var. corymbosa]
MIVPKGKTQSLQKTLGKKKYTRIKLPLAEMKIAITVAVMMLCCCMAMAAAVPLQAVPMEYKTVSFDGKEAVEAVDPQSPEAVERWFRYTLPYSAPKLTTFKFYYHENRVAATPTAVEVARANITATSPTMFGSTMVIDDPLTAGPEPDSLLVGRAQGLYSAASQEEPAFILTFNVVFTAEPFKGSTLSIIARDAITNTYREPSIVGGSGVFRLARGAVSTHTYSLDQATLNAVVEYNVFVIHY